jgi:bifunctional non-homologous end joining protein LigD
MPLPRWVEPQLSKLAERAPTGPRWVHEIKFDGMLELDGEDVARLPLLEQKERLRFGIT